MSFVITLTEQDFRVWRNGSSLRLTTRAGGLGLNLQVATALAAKNR